MSTGERDCRHLCCDERDNPFHDHFLPPEQCPRCDVEREAIVDARAIDAARAASGETP